MTRSDHNNSNKLDFLKEAIKFVDCATVAALVEECVKAILNWNV